MCYNEPYGLLGGVMTEATKPHPENVLATALAETAYYRFVFFRQLLNRYVPKK